MPYLLKMLKHTLYSTIIFLVYSSPNFANDFYSKFFQNDYKINFQRSQLIDYSKSIFNFVEVKTFKYNRTLPVMNITINSKVNMSTELEIAVQVYKFLSNEYRELPGMNYHLNYCKAVAANIVGLQILHKSGNFTLCQIVQGTTYKAWNAYPDESRNPPFLPNGEFKDQVDVIRGDEIIATLNIYYKIYRPIAIPRKHKTVY